MSSFLDCGVLCFEVDVILLVDDMELFTISSVVRILRSAESTVYVILTGDDVMVVFSWCVYVRCFYIIHFCEDIVGIC